MRGRPRHLADQPTPFHRLVRVELRKSYDTRAGFWLLAAIGLIVLAAEIIVLVVATGRTRR